MAAGPVGRPIWVDAQLPPALARWLTDECGEDAAHVQDLELLRASDTAIFERAGAANAVVVTKDLDFVQLLERRGPPPQVIWLTAGNLSTAHLIALVARHWPRVVQLLEYEGLVEIGGK